MMPRLRRRPPCSLRAPLSLLSLAVLLAVASSSDSGQAGTSAAKAQPPAQKPEPASGQPSFQTQVELFV